MVEINKIGKNIYEIPKIGDMKVSGIVYASEDLVKAMKQDKTLEQVKNVACLPGILQASIAVADAHQGYGFPIGGIAAFDLDKGVISPGGVGYDINCSVRLLKTNLKKKDFLAKQKEVVEALFRKVPSGVGRGSKFQITRKELDKLLEGGAKYIVQKGFGVDEDFLHTEENGAIPGAQPEKVSEHAIKRGIGQVGTLGAGNHFLEIQVVDEIFDEEVAKVFGLEKDQVTIMVHCGSRGLGHQVASDYIKLMEEEFFRKKSFQSSAKHVEREEEYGFANLSSSEHSSGIERPKANAEASSFGGMVIRDRELINAPINSKLGRDYYAAMACAANFAFANKQLITHWIREELKHIFPEIKVDVVYDVCHNIAKFEEHEVNGKKMKVCVHRKGATRSFGPGRKEIPVDYRKVGQPVIIPGSMGTASYVLVGTKKAEELTWGSTVHGAGRLSSRSKALRDLKGEKIKKSLNEKGIEVKTMDVKALAEEAPEAYKDIEEVVRVVDELGISKKVARLKPLGVIKG